MEYVQLTLDDWMEMKHKLKMELQGVKQSFVRIGYALRRMDDQKLYERDGYKSIAEFAKAEYGLESSTVSRFMSINREYSIDGYSEHLKPEYMDLGRSQLEEMLKLPEEDRKMILPETPRDDIRELKRFNKNVPQQGEADNLKEVIQKFFEANRERLELLYDSDAFLNGNLDNRELIEIVNPSGTKTFKKGLYFLMLYESDIKFKEFGGTPQTLSWRRFFEITKEIYGERLPEQQEQEKPERMPEATEAQPQATLSEKSEEQREEAKHEQPEREQTEQEEQAEAPKEQKATESKGQQTEIMPEPVQAEVIEEEEENEESMDGTADAAENEPAAEENGEEKAERVALAKRHQTRKEYIDRLSEKGFAEYLAEEYQNNSFKVTYLTFVGDLLGWLSQKVDEFGKAVEDAR